MLMVIVAVIRDFAFKHAAHFPPHPPANIHFTHIYGHKAVENPNNTQHPTPWLVKLN